MKNNKNVSKPAFKLPSKLIMLGLLIISVIIIVIAIYVTEFVSNNVSAKKAFTESITEGAVEVSEEDFLKHFKKFELKQNENDLKYPYKDETGELVIGSVKVSLSTEYIGNNAFDKKDYLMYETTRLNVTVCYGADWFGIVSSNGSLSSYEIGKDKTSSAFDFNVLFPTRKLLFVSAKHPELFAYVSWTHKNVNYYTLLEYEYDEYIQA